MRKAQRAFAKVPNRLGSALPKRRQSQTVSLTLPRDTREELRSNGRTVTRHNVKVATLLTSPESVKLHFVLQRRAADSKNFGCVRNIPRGLG